MAESTAHPTLASVPGRVCREPAQPSRGSLCNLVRVTRVTAPVCLLSTFVHDTDSLGPCTSPSPESQLLLLPQPTSAWDPRAPGSPLTLLPLVSSSPPGFP